VLKLGQNPKKTAKNLWKPKNNPLTLGLERSDREMRYVSSHPHKHRRIRNKRHFRNVFPASTVAGAKDNAAAALKATPIWNQGATHMAKGMTKTVLVRTMAEKLEITNKQAAAGLELLAELAVKETKKNGEFTIPGIGKLVKAERKARMGRNPQTGEPIKIKAKTVVKFRVAKVAKDTIAPPKEVGCAAWMGQCCGGGDENTWGWVNLLLTCTQEAKNTLSLSSRETHLLSGCSMC
jgi:DNA-binding protein HU-beta